MHGRHGWWAQVPQQNACNVLAEPENRQIAGRLRRMTPLLALVLCVLGSIPASAAAAPPTATTEAATAVSYEQATLKGTVNPEGAATTYYFEYGETTSYGSKIPITPESVGSGTTNVSVSKLVTGLKQSTTYHFRIAAESEGGTAQGEDAVFTTAGFNFSFSEPGSGNGQLAQPFDLAIDSEGAIWVADTENSRVEKFNEKGEYVAQFGKKGTGSGEFESPEGIAIDSEGNIWVVDSGNNRVQKFNSKGEFLGKFGEEGSGEGQFKSPSGIAFDSSDRPFIVDTGNDRVQKFNGSFKFLSQVGKEGSGEAEFKSPTGIDIDSAGRLWVVDTGNNRVQRFNASTFNYISKFGKEGSGNNVEFQNPIGVLSDFQERIWVVDSGNNRVQKFNREGELQDQIGKEGSGAGQFIEPTGIAAPATQKLLILDAGNDRVEGWTVKAEPPKATTNPASNVKTSSATLNANLNPEAFATTYYFEYGLTESYGTKIPLVPESIGSGTANVLVEQPITGLSEGTRYHFRVVAESAAGTSVGIDRTFKTL